MRSVANGRTDILLDLVAEIGSDSCVVNGLAVNASGKPVVSLDVALVVVARSLDKLRQAARAKKLREELFEHHVNLSMEGPDLRFPLQTNPRHQAFLSRATEREILGYWMKVTSLEDVLRGKIGA